MIAYTGYIDADPDADDLGLPRGQITVHYVVDGTMVALTTTEALLSELGTTDDERHDLFAAAGQLLDRPRHRGDLQAAFPPALHRAARLVRAQE